LHLIQGLLQKQLLAQIYLLVIIQHPHQIFSYEENLDSASQLVGLADWGSREANGIEPNDLAELRNIALDDGTCLRVNRNLEVL